MAPECPRSRDLNNAYQYTRSFVNTRYQLFMASGINRIFVWGPWHRKLPFAVIFRCLRAFASMAALTRPPAKHPCIYFRYIRMTRGQHSIAREASISPIFGVSRPGVHFSARFFLVGLPLTHLTGPLPLAASAVPAPSRGGVRQVRNTGPLSP